MNHPTVIFDGVCNLCNSTVDFLIRHDRTGELLFGSFQEEAGRRLLLQHGVVEPPETVYFIEDGKLYSESDAILRLCRYMNAPWRWLRLSAFIPTSWRNAAYRFIARNRYRWFGKKDSCRIPTAEERSRFL
jgi:predicted DCC family thiol-disulfide oxidoreductase YuxK